MKRTTSSRYLSTLAIRSCLAVGALTGLATSPASATPKANADGPGSFAYEGRIYTDKGEPSAKSIQLILRVMDPAGTCILREERTGPIDLSASNGYFSANVGKGTPTVNDPGLPLALVFANGTNVSGKTDAGVSCALAPISGAGRLLRVFIVDGTTTTAMTPDVPIGTTPYAVVADTLQGMPPAAFVQTSAATGVTQANIESLTSAARLPMLQSLADGTSTQYVKAGANGAATLPTFPAPPSSPVAGNIWYDNTSNAIKFYNGTSTQVLSTGGGGSGITSLTVGPNLTANGTPGGTLSAPGTIDLADTGAGGSYAKVNVDTKGRVVSGSALAESDLPLIASPGKINGGAITSGVIGGTTALNTTGNVDANAVHATSMSSRGIALYDTAGVRKITWNTPNGMAADATYTMPFNTGTPGYALTTDGTGILSWSPMGGGGALNSLTVNPPLQSTGGTNPNLMLPPANAANDGYLTMADWMQFNNKLSSSLQSGKMWVGSASNIATEMQPSGDVTMNPSAMFTVTRLQGNQVMPIVPAGPGQTLRWDGAAQWVPSYLSLADIRSTVVPGNTIFPNTSCTPSQTLSWSTLTDTFTCVNVQVPEAQMSYSPKPANMVLASPDITSGMPVFRGLVPNDIPYLDWSKINTGKPSTLAGYGITNAVVSVGIPSVWSGPDGNRGAPGQTGRIYFADDTRKIYRDNGGSWDVMGDPGTWIPNGADISYQTGNVQIGNTDQNFATPLAVGTSHAANMPTVATFSSWLGSSNGVVNDSVRLNFWGGAYGGGIANSAALISRSQQGSSSNAVKGGFLFKVANDSPTPMVDAMLIDNYGHVGIGTTLPQTSLYVRSPANATNAIEVSIDGSNGGQNLAQSALNLVTTSSGGAGLGMSGVNGWQLAANSNYYSTGTSQNAMQIGYVTNGSWAPPAMFFKPNGWIGVNNTAPVSLMTIDGGQLSIRNMTTTAANVAQIALTNHSGSGKYPAITFRNDNSPGIGGRNKAGIFGSGSGSFGLTDLRFVVNINADNNDADPNTDTKMIIAAASGNVGIGTLAPNAKLEVAGSAILGTGSTPDIKLGGVSAQPFRGVASTLINTTTTAPGFNLGTSMTYGTTQQATISAASAGLNAVQGDNLVCNPEAGASAVTQHLTWSCFMNGTNVVLNLNCASTPATNCVLPGAWRVTAIRW